MTIVKKYAEHLQIRSAKTIFVAKIEKQIIPINA